MDKHTKYIERSDINGATHLEISVYYTKGGANYFSGGTIRRGYYISVMPVTKGNDMVSFELFSGRKRLLFETARYTAKQFGRAVELAKNVEAELIAAVVTEIKAA